MPVELLQDETTAVHRAAIPPDRTPPAGRIVFHPRYEHFLRRCGLDSATAALALSGEVVCGHPDRHVVRTGLGTGSARRTVYLKREHAVGVKTRMRNARAGFGWVSRSEREARTLRSLEAAGLPGPQWLAYGEDDASRAFLIVDDLDGRTDLTTTLDGLGSRERSALAPLIGRAVAELHAAGFGTPELAAKHVLVHPVTAEVTLIDWQSAPLPGPVALSDRVRQLGTLDASVRSDRACDRDRLRLAHVYLRTWRRTAGAGEEVPRFGAFVRAIRQASGRSVAKSSVRDQHLRPGPTLVWLAGEAVCVVPALESIWPEPADGPPFYPAGGEAGEEWVTFRDGRRGLLVRFRTRDPLGRLVAALRERPWRSPASVAARTLFHLYRHRVPAPTLLAFGQRARSASTADSFVLYDPPSSGIPVGVRLTQFRDDLEPRRRLLRDCGATLRAIHDAGCRLIFGTRPLFVVARSGEVALDSPFGVRLVRQVPEATRDRDLAEFIRRELPGLERTDRLRVVSGYHGEGAAWPIAVRSAARSIL
jgi:tRNA A-37 threonylcarbamoyl transferase component Bud32